MKNIFERIKKLTEEKSMSISELEKKANLGNGTIRRWPQSMPSADKIYKVSKLLGVSVEYLLTGSLDEPFSHSIKNIAYDINTLPSEQIEIIKLLIKEFKKK